MTQESPTDIARRGVAYRMMSDAYRNNTLTAWVDINHMLRSLLWFIVGKMRPSMHEMEIGAIASDFRGNYWFGENGGEDLYALAVSTGHPSAPISVERYLNRAPFWIEEDGEKRRLYVGRIFIHGGECLRVTSFFEHGVRCVRDGIDAKAGVVEVLREGLEAEREAVRKARLEAGKKAREASRADPTYLLPLREHLTLEVPRISRGRYVPPEYVEFASQHGKDYKAAYNAIPCGHAVAWYLVAIGMRRDGYTTHTADEIRKNYPWSKVEQHLFRTLRNLRGLPLKNV